MSLDTNWLCASAMKKDMNQRKNPATESFCINEYVGAGVGDKFSGEPKTSQIFRGEFIRKLALGHILGCNRGEVKLQGLMARQLCYKIKICSY